MEPTIEINLTQQEINVLKQLIHLAVTARGMEVAEAAVVLTKKLDERPEVKNSYPRAAE